MIGSYDQVQGNGFLQSGLGAAQSALVQCSRVEQNISSVYPDEMRPDGTKACVWPQVRIVFSRVSHQIELIALVAVLHFKHFGTLLVPDPQYCRMIIAEGLTHTMRYISLSEFSLLLPSSKSGNTFKNLPYTQTSDLLLTVLTQQLLYHGVCPTSYQKYQSTRDAVSCSIANTEVHLRKLLQVYKNNEKKKNTRLVGWLNILSHELPDALM